MQLLDGLLDRPRLDFALAVAVGVLAGVFLPPVVDRALGSQLYGAIATVSSIVLGFSAVVRNRFLAAVSTKLGEIYQLHAPTLRRNIKYVMVYCASAAIMALALFFVPDSFSRILTGVSAGMVALIAFSLVRLVVLYEVADRGEDIALNSPREHVVHF